MLGLNLAEVLAQVAERVDAELRRAVLAAQETVVGVLDPRLADAVAALDVAVALLVVELLLADLAHVTDELGTHLLVRVLAQEHLLDVDPREVVAVLEQVADHRPLDVLLDRRRRERLRLELALDLALDPLRAHAEHPRQAPVHGRAFGRRLGQLVACHLDGVRQAVVDDHPALAVDDLAPRGLHLDAAQLVVVGLGLVLVAREHLQIPQAEEHERERHEGNTADDRHPQRERRRERGAVVVVEIHQA